MDYEEKKVLDEVYKRQDKRRKEKQELKKEVQAYFDNLTDEGFYNVLENAGFEVTNGTGSILLTDQTQIHGNVQEGNNNYYLEAEKVIGEDMELGILDLQEVLKKFKGKKVFIDIQVVDY